MRYTAKAMLLSRSALLSAGLLSLALSSGALAQDATFVMPARQATTRSRARGSTPQPH